jgi:hypothetical protein
MEWFELAARREANMALLRERLARARSALRDDPQAAITLATEAAVRLIDEDPTVEVGETEPLALLVHALNDLMEGGKPPLLQPRKRSKDGKPTGGRPTNTASHLARGIITHCFEPLAKTGINLQEAAQFIADECNKIGLKLDGQTPDARTVLRWRRETGGAAPVLATDMHKRLAASAALQRDALSTDEARQYVQCVLRTLASGGFL